MKDRFRGFAGIAVVQESETKCLLIAGIETPFFYVVVGSSAVPIGHKNSSCISRLAELKLAPWRCLDANRNSKMGRRQKFVATSPSGHAITIDSDRASNKAPGPMELVLLALGACTATDVVMILEKKRQKLESLEVICSGERATEPPTIWIKLELLYRLRGQLDDAAVKHAIQLSEEKYCSVSAMLRKTGALSWRYEILPPAT